MKTHCRIPKINHKIWHFFALSSIIEFKCAWNERTKREREKKKLFYFYLNGNNHVLIMMMTTVILYDENSKKKKILRKRHRGKNSHRIWFVSRAAISFINFKKHFNRSIKLFFLKFLSDYVWNIFLRLNKNNKKSRKE